MLKPKRALRKTGGSETSNITRPTPPTSACVSHQSASSFQRGASPLNLSLIAAGAQSDSSCHRVTESAGSFQRRTPAPVPKSLSGFGLLDRPRFISEGAHSCHNRRQDTILKVQYWNR